MNRTNSQREYDKRYQFSSWSRMEYGGCRLICIADCLTSCNVGGYPAAQSAEFKVTIWDGISTTQTEDTGDTVDSEHQGADFVDGSGGDGRLHQGEFPGYLHAKYASNPYVMCVASYRNCSALMRTSCHGAWSGKRAPSQSRIAMAPKACAQSHRIKDPA